jgi:hypothetical protein
MGAEASDPSVTNEANDEKGTNYRMYPFLENVSDYALHVFWGSDATTPSTILGMYVIMHQPGQISRLQMSVLVFSSKSDVFTHANCSSRQLDFTHQEVFTNIRPLGVFLAQSKISKENKLH